MVGRSAQVARGLNTISANIVANSDILLKYGIQVKGANGELKSTYDVLTELKPVWDELNGVERQSLGQTLAGKNQYRVLASIMQNFQHAIEATNTAMNAQGSALEENAAYMESLEARTNLVKADFQSLANNVINSQLVKSLLSLADVLLQVADTGLGRILIQLTLLGGIGWGAGHLLKASKILGVFKNDLVGFGKLLLTITGQQELLAVATTASAAASEADADAKAKEAMAAKAASIALKEALIVLGFFIGTAAAIYGLVKLFDKLNITYDEHKQKLKDINKEYEELTSEGSELDQLKNKIGALTEAEKNRLAILLAQESSLKRQSAQEAGLAYESYTQEHTEDRYISEGDRAYWQTIDLSAEAANKARNAFNGLSDSYNKGKISAEDYKIGIYEQINALKEDAEYLKTVQDAGQELTDGQTSLIEIYDFLTNQLTETTEATGDFVDNVEEGTVKLSSLTETLDDLATRLSVVKSAFEDFNDDGELTYSTISDIIDKFSELDEDVLDDYVSRLTDANLTGAEFKSIMSDMTIALIEKRIETQGLTEDDKDLVAMMLKEIGVVNSNEIATRLLSKSVSNVKTQTNEAKTAISDFNATPVDVSAKIASVKSLYTAFGNLLSIVHLTAAEMAAVTGHTWTKKSIPKTSVKGSFSPKLPAVEWEDFDLGSSGSGGGGGRTTKETTYLEQLEADLKSIEDKHSNILSLTESEYNLLVDQGAPTEEIVAKAQEYLDQLHQQNNDLRDLLGTVEDTEETHGFILELQSKINKNGSTWYDWAKKVDGVYTDIADEGAKIVKQLEEEWQKSVDEQVDALEALQGQMVDYYDGQIDGIDKQIEALKDTNNVLENQIALEQKLDAIARARQQKAMVYKDGRWQYVEDVDAVSAAISDFQDYIRERQLQEQIEGLEKEKSAIEDIKDAWNNMTKEFDIAKDKWLISQKLAIDITLADWQRLVDGVGTYTAQYASLMSGESPYKTTKTSSGGYSTTTSKGGTVTYSSEEAVNFIESAKVGSTMVGGDDSIWTKQSDGSTVITAKDGAVAVVNPSSYASGTLSATGGLSLVGEQGAELRVLNRGDGILPADITRNLMAWGQTTPMQYIGNKFGQAMNVTIQALNLPNVVDGQGFVDYIRNNLFGQVLSFVH